jgi:hypothetical protein
MQPHPDPELFGAGPLVLAKSPLSGHGHAEGMLGGLARDEEAVALGAHLDAVVRRDRFTDDRPLAESATPQSVPSRLSIAVEPSTSLNIMVTVPDGNASTSGVSRQAAVLI